ncbi:asparagine synthase (glutamine-hydrolyzing) [Algoriphagus sp.]|uniref:asparagine synthase (glutamine-hydrolyzing) n=1 Tax=Algoriphagus sp. TaxID=1872435 RepID=UPI0025D78655|nr:asparagine synthase (glutamine-hydrolyzing) [Algoriphagus sp.]
MCGIHLIWGKGANKTVINKLLSQSKHRGPDQDAAISPWPGMWVGVNRLKILHPGPDADQPFWSADGNSMLVWNGEIYNYKSLRNLLEKMGIEFITDCDTEVLINWIKVFGVKGLEKLEGMFALIYLDLKDNSILVARDPNGEKPLYYSQNQDRLIISSEASGIANFIKAPLDENQTEHYYFFRSPLPGKTFYKGVKEWKAGRYSHIFQHSTFRWDNIPILKYKVQNLGKEEFKERLNEAVRTQFHADVPVGIMLSGGMDSSLLYSTWYNQTGTSIPAYTIQVEKKYRKKYADGDAAIELVKKIPAQHHLIEMDQKVFWENWEDYLNSIDFPIGDSAGFLTWMIGKEAKKKVKVLISGAGADELWGGYNRHSAYDFYLQNQRLLLMGKTFLQALPLSRSVRKFFNSIDSNPVKTFLNFSALQPVSDDLASDYERVFNPNLSSYKKALDFDRQVYLVQDVLKIHDQALMAHSIEGRSPYLSGSMISFWREIADESVLKKKLWIKDLLIDSGLEQIAQREKFGFGLPLQEWLSEKGEFSSRVFNKVKAFEKSHGEFFPLEMRILAKNPESGVKFQFLALYNIFLLAEWVELKKL